MQVIETQTQPATIDPQRARTAQTPATPPQWGPTFADALANGPGGYAYCVMQNGVLVDSGAWGYARMPTDTSDGQGVAFTTDTRCNLASVSKTVTATALFTMVARSWVTSVNELFWTYLQPAMPSVQLAQGVGTVTMGQLLAMVSRLPEDGTLYTANEVSSTQFIESYLASEALLPRQQYSYSNTNFTILQEVITAVAQAHEKGDYLQWVATAVLKPLGIDVSAFSSVPDDPSVATLTYNGQIPDQPGFYWPAMQCVGPGGWIASANDLVTYLAGIGSNSVLNPWISNYMMQQGLGWYPAATNSGLAYHHNGGLTSGSGTGLSTGVVRFPGGYNAVLLSNKSYDDIIPLMLDAYDTGSPAAA